MPTIARAVLLRPGKGMPVAASVKLAARELRSDRVVAFPTETVYGLGANVFSERAVRKIFRIKGRPADNPLIVHVASRAQARALMQSVPRQFDKLAAHFWPGPLTLVVPKNAAVPDCVTAGLATVGIRMPAHPMARALIRACGTPIAAPSANISGRPSPTTAADVLEDLGAHGVLVLDGGPCALGIESTVLDLSGDAPMILRPGSITAAQIEDVLGLRVRAASASVRRPASPGMKYRHYAPRTPLYLVAKERRATTAVLRAAVAGLRAAGRRVALLAGSDCASVRADAFYPLGNGTPVDYARHMYQGMRALDKSGADVMLCPAIEEQGIGLAVMNRLKKAAEGKYQSDVPILPRPRGKRT